MPSWLTNLLALVNEVPQLIALIEKLFSSVSNAEDKKTLVQNLSKAVDDLTQ